MPSFKTYIYSNDGNTLYGVYTNSGPNGMGDKVSENGIIETLVSAWTVYNGATISTIDNSFILPIMIQGLTLTANSTNIDVSIGQSIVYNNNYYCVEASTPQPTLTFKHFYDAGTIGSGTVKFRHYSQQEPSSGETWVLNADLGAEHVNKTTIPFVSNNMQFVAIEISTRNIGPQGAYYYTDDTTPTVACEYNTWTNEAYRTITFATAPTGDLLTWLQANGTKQGGGGGSNVVTLNDTNILAPMTTSVLSVTRGTFTTTAEPTFYTTNNDADKVIVGSKGYPLIEKINDANATEIVTANQFFETFGITETNKGTTITGNWEFVCGFGGRLTTTQGTNGGDFEVWGTNEDGFENIKGFGEIEDVLFVVYDTETDTAAVYELDEYNGEFGTFKVSAEVGYNKITSFATRVIE